MSIRATDSGRQIADACWREVYYAAREHDAEKERELESKSGKAATQN